MFSAETAKYLKDNLTFNTISYVIIKHWPLGLFRYSLMLLLGIWVVVYKIMYLGDHLLAKEVKGFVDVNLVAPSFGLPNCDPDVERCKVNLRSLLDLPYCLEAKMTPNASSFGASVQPCKFEEVEEIFHRKFYDAHLISTHISLYDVPDECNVVEANNGSCSKKVAGYFVADVERYFVRISHSFFTDAGDDLRAIGSHELTANFCAHAGGGYVASMSTCPRAPSLCLQDDCVTGALTWDMLGNTSSVSENATAESQLFLDRNESNLQADSMQADSRILNLHDFPMFRWDNSDYFTVASLLHIAGVKLDDIPERGSRSHRYMGLNLEVLIEYSNRKSWPGLHITPWKAAMPEYAYHVRNRYRGKLKMRHWTPSSLSDIGDEAAHSGIRIHITQSGILLEWDIFSLLVVFSAAGGVWLVLQLCLDIFLVYLSRHSSVYEGLIYETRVVEDTTAARE